MDKSIEAAVEVGKSWTDVVIKHAIAAYRDAEIERLTAELAEAVNSIEITKAKGWDLLVANKRMETEMADLRAQLAARDAEVGRLRDLLSRYYREVPLGHQPHMIAHLVEAALKGEG